MERCVRIKCFECEGTGSTVPDCELCKGTRSVRLKRAYAKGWRKEDLCEEGCGEYCYCPECYDDAGPCVFCFGDGSIDPFIESQQRARVLLMAKYNDRIPACFKRDRLGRLIVDKEINLLSMSHARALREEGLIEYFGSFFGHSIMMHDAAKVVTMDAEFFYRDLCRQFIKDREKQEIEQELYKEIESRPRYAESAF